MTQNIEGKVAVITNASSGPGEATAQHLTAAGAKLVLGARRIERLRALAGELGLERDDFGQNRFGIPESARV